MQRKSLTISANNAYLENMKTLASYLKDNKVSQKTLAETCGLDETTISRMMNGRHLPRMATLRKISKATGDKVSALEMVVEFYLSEASKERMAG